MNHGRPEKGGDPWGKVGQTEKRENKHLPEGLQEAPHHEEVANGIVGHRKVVFGIGQGDLAPPRLQEGVFNGVLGFGLFICRFRLLAVGHPLLLSLFLLSHVKFLAFHSELVRQLNWEAIVFGVFHNPRASNVIVSRGAVPDKLFEGLLG